MARRFGTALVIAVALAGCGAAVIEPTPIGSGEPSTPFTASPSTRPAATPQPIPDAWAPLLGRPLDVPSLARGDPCPTTKTARATDFAGPALGDGPIYPMGYSTEGVVQLDSGRRSLEGRDWLTKKTLWVSDDTYRGIALVRAVRIDGAGLHRFILATALLKELRLTLDGWVYGGSPPGWREWNTGSGFTDPGCYAFQVDGDSFTRVIIVEVREGEA